MIRNMSDLEVNEIKGNFINGIPFPHVVIDSFLDEEIVQGLHKDFPPFRASKAMNEFGKAGPKCVYSDIENISDNYARFYEYINSKNFLSLVSRLTGIDDLISDPYLFGAGTHENIEGAELDCHIDFNYDGGKNHRRLNLLIYLNEEWDPSWGGAIELHSDPFCWIDGSDEVITTNCIFNRCVIFETSEVSWHGFKKIELPKDKKHLSRKLISIYLYTKDRPSEEIAPRHGTFYLPYAPDFSKNANVNFNDEVKRLLIKRDGLLRLAWKTELQLSKQIEEARSYIHQLKAAITPNIVGNVIVQVGSVRDYFHDKWIGPDFSITFNPLDNVRCIKIDGWNPDKTKLLEIKVREKTYTFDVIEGKFSVELTLESKIDTPFDLTLISEPKESTNADKRQLSVIVDVIKIS